MGSRAQGQRCCRLWSQAKPNWNLSFVALLGPGPFCKPQFPGLETVIISTATPAIAGVMYPVRTGDIPGSRQMGVCLMGMGEGLGANVVEFECQLPIHQVGTLRQVSFTFGDVSNLFREDICFTVPSRGLL